MDVLCYGYSMRFNVCLYLSYHELHWSVREGFVAINLANIGT